MFVLNDGLRRPRRPLDSTSKHYSSKEKVVSDLRQYHYLSKTNINNKINNKIMCSNHFEQWIVCNHQQKHRYQRCCNDYDYLWNQQKRLFANITSSSTSSGITSNDNNDNNVSKEDNFMQQPKNDLAERQEKINVTKDKLRDLLNDLGMSISQWNIHNHSRPLSGNSSQSSRRRKRPMTRRVEEEFDVYNQPYGSSRRKLYKSSLMMNKISARLRVRSVHAAQQIDIVSVLTNVFGPTTEMPAIRHMFGKTSVIIQLPPTTAMKENDGKDNSPSDNDVESFFHPESQPRFIAVFRFGSIVFFNVRPKDAGIVLDKVKKYSKKPISRSFERKEHFEVAISPEMEQDAHVTSDFAIVKELNINNVAVLSTIMAQTVAFDAYSDVVDEMLATFDEINSTVKKTGNFTSMQKETLFKVVAQNNSLFIDMIAKLGIKDRSDTAWNNPQYEKIHEGMKNEFEIESRFEHIEFKLNLIQQNAKFFLEILHNQKSDFLEWIIIVLIGFECLLMMLDMSGFGENIFDMFLSSSTPSPRSPTLPMSPETK